MNISDRAIALASNSEARYSERNVIREKRLNEANQGNCWGADDPERVAKRFAHVKKTEQHISRILGLAGREPSAISRDVSANIFALAQERTIGRDDLVAPQFLKLALAASRYVCRITVRGQSGAILGYGTGILVGPGILLTNHHVLKSINEAANSEATFGFESGITSASDERIVGFQPQRFFITDEELDFTFVSVANVDTHGRSIDDLGYISLNQEEGKAINGEYVNVIQHPNGGPKMFALRENRIVDVLSNFLHYAADTAPGSSGSPVFNDQYEIVALHHSGVPERDSQGRVLNRSKQIWTSDQGEAAVLWKANEGVRISVLVERAKSLAKTAEEQTLLAKACDVSRSIPQLEYRSDSLQNRNIGQPELIPSISGNIATWTIPLSVSVNLGAKSPDAWVPNNNVVAPQPEPKPAPSAAAVLGSKSRELMQAVSHAREAFSKIPGVMRVRAGWKFSDGWITDKAAIVVIIEEKKTTAALKNEDIPKLPGMFDGFPVDVRQASPEELYEFSRLGIDAVLEERTANPSYVKPSDLSLPRIKEQMKVTVHVSPEYGWPVLKDFLSRTNKKLTVAMYDFGAPHIIKEITARHIAVGADMQLVIQYGSSVGGTTKANDHADDETVQIIQNALGPKFNMQWANVSQKDSLWASAYHIKVAVRDSSSIWLSSGNWQSSNQAPDAPPDDEVKAKSLLGKYNREWHVVIDNATLANIFESYIQYDYDQSKGFVPKGAAEAYEILPRLEPDEREAAAEIRIFEPLVVDRIVDVQPVLTPDNYIQKVLPLIKSAKSKIYFQNQYINESLDERAAENYLLLIEAIAEKQQEGLDVRIILRSDNGVEARHIEFLKTYGIDMDSIRWRNRTHTKGIIVDSNKVLLGSHNWSYDGTVLNRDASLIFYDKEIAQYLEEIFIYDWENWSKSKVYIRQKKPTVVEIATAERMAKLKEEIESTGIRARRLFHQDD